MEREEIRRLWHLAEILYCGGKPLQAFLVLFQCLQHRHKEGVLHGGIDVPGIKRARGNEHSASGASEGPSFPPYLKLEEVATRVRAVEFLLHDDAPRVRSASAAVGSSRSIQLSRQATLQKLELSQYVLAPLFAIDPAPLVKHRAEDRECEPHSLHSSKSMSSDYFFNWGTVDPLVLEGSAFILRKGTTSAGHAGIFHIASNGAALRIPVALVTKVFVLQSEIARRKHNFRKSLNCLAAAEEWLQVVFDHRRLPQFAQLMWEELQERCTTPSERDYLLSFQSQIEGAVVRLIAHEQRHCMALVKLEYCRVYYAVLTSLLCPSATTWSHMMPGEAAVNMFPSATSGSRAAKHTDVKQGKKEFIENVRLLAECAQYDHTWTSCTLLPAVNENGPTSPSVAWEACLPVCMHRCCFTRDTSKPDKSPVHFDAIVTALGFYCCYASMLQLRYGLQNEGSGCGTCVGTSVLDMALRHVVPQVELCGDHNVHDELILWRQLLELAHSKYNAPTHAGNDVDITGNPQQGVEMPLQSSLNVHNWVPVGVRYALQLYLRMLRLLHHPSSWSTSHAIVTHEQHPDVALHGCSRTQSIEQTAARVLDCIEKELLGMDGSSEECRLMCPTNTPADFSSISVLYSSSLTQVRFLIQLKAATMITLCSYYLTDLDCVKAVAQLNQLQGFMQVFHRHTRPFLCEVHLLSACVAMHLSVRELPNSLLSHSYSLALLSSASCRRLGGRPYYPRKSGEGVRDELGNISSDVGLAYYHLQAAEDLIHDDAHDAPSSVLCVKLLKAFALYQTATSGKRVDFLFTEHVSQSPGSSPRASTNSPSIRSRHCSIPPEMKRICLPVPVDPAAPDTMPRQSQTDVLFSTEQVLKECTLAQHRPQHPPGSDFVVKCIAPTQRHRCAAALVHMLEVLDDNFARYVGLKNEESSHRAATRECQVRETSAWVMAAWTPCNIVLYRLLRGLVALTEDRDEPAAAHAFKAATRYAKSNFGMLSPFVADGLQLLSTAYKQLHGEPLVKTTGRTLVDTRGQADYAQAVITAAGVAKRASRTALYHLERYHQDSKVLATPDCDAQQESKTRRWWELQVRQLCTLSAASNPTYKDARESKCGLVGRRELVSVLTFLPGTPTYSRFEAH